ncbi:DUF6241 domain-containing protein [Sporosarcina luteola]|uniref:DUF6241 domain-containing protein n=1 Tax=Sporosarcina luteola TaxID=582850 RepID=UPI00204008FC|nr:DUF6241 domain-containing protein [Sporosarcina luteola]MCM3709379.1 DUF6241 domain-containing protein [Sporosarcina luteola]
MKYKKIIVLSIAVLGLASYLISNQLTKEDVTIEVIRDVPSGDYDRVVGLFEIEEERKIPVEKEFPFSMTELDVQTAIHGMSHQKIRADGDDKWDLLLMTPERIERLIVVVEANNIRYRKKQDIYLSILNRWKNNDFSQVDIDHNLVWELQNGDKGRAVGILTTEEEIKFIKEHYNVEVVDITSD